MPFKGLMLSASLGLALVSTTPARADICFEYTISGGGVAIALGAKVPAAPNTCERVTVVSADGGVGTGSICRSEEGAGRPTLVYQYSFSACTSPYFEAATCRIDLDINSQLPTQEPPSQSSSCTGVYAGMAPHQTSPLGGFSYFGDLKAWNCTAGPFAVIDGGGSTCFARGKGASLGAGPTRPQGAGPTPQNPDQK
jgi:hypothetical protein